MLHLGNTFFLLASLVLTAHSAKLDAHTVLSWKRTERLARALALFPLFLLFMVGTSGAIAALGDTLFPVDSLSAGFAQDASPSAHMFLRLRVLHPVFALIAGVVVMLSGTVLRFLRATQRSITNLSRLTTFLFFTQFCVGVANLFLRAPIAVQLVHLILADFVWLAATRLCFETFTAFGFARDASPLPSDEKRSPKPLHLPDPS